MTTPEQRIGDAIYDIDEHADTAYLRSAMHVLADHLEIEHPANFAHRVVGRYIANRDQDIYDAREAETDAFVELEQERNR